MQKLSIIIPVYNEEKTIEQVLQKIAALNLPHNWEKEIIVVDDGSTDNTRFKIEDFRLQNYKIYRHKKNQGKGAAIRTALAYATGDYVIIQDADLEYDPSDILALLQKLGENPQKAIFGSRNLAPKRRGYWHYVLGAHILTTTINLLYGARLTDSYTCYKLIPTSLLGSLALESHGFEFEAEVTCKILKTRCQIVEAPISYNPRSFAQGKKIKFKDAVKGMWTILKIWL